MAQEQKQNQNQLGKDEILEQIDSVLLKKKLEEAEAKAEEYLNNWKRERADFLNYKKDETKTLEEFAKFANEALLIEILDVVDDLEITAKHSSENIGLNQVLKKFSELLKKHGVEKIKVEGEKFDPELHEAISTEENRNPIGNSSSSNGASKIEEIRAGYTMHGKVIRPARVKIIR
ncbi:MAG: nucleotide exchange factor GrpE [Minisyncoccia bacterium]